MKAAVLSSGRGWHTTDLIRAFEARGHMASFLPLDRLSARIGLRPAIAVDGEELDAFDAVVLRTIPAGSLEQIIFRIDSLHCLERMGVTVLNPARVIERTVDKFFTSRLLEEAGLPTPRTVVAQTTDAAMKAFREMGDVIVKPLFGSNGRGIVRIDEEEIAHRVFRALELERAVFYLQEALPHEGRDLRVFITGETIVAAIWRRAEGWITNISRGAKAEKAEVPDAWAALALEAAHTLGAEYAGVDLLPTSDGRVHVLEVNGSPGWRGLQPASGVDVAQAIVGHLERMRGR